MSDFAPEPIVTRMFQRIRQRFDLGIQEYLAAIAAIRQGWGIDSLEDLYPVLRLLWCHSVDQQRQFWEIWQSVIASRPSTPKPEKEAPVRESTEDPAIILPKPPSLELAPPPVQSTANLAPLLVQTPEVPMALDDVSGLQTYYPVSRRSLSYFWRYLRRTVADGPLDVLDVDATIQQVSEQGFFLAPAWRRREVNRAHLVLLIDQDGSMMPLHRFTRDVVETAQSDSAIANVEVYYFHNVPTYLYQDTYLTQSVELELVLANCDSETSILIVSDAGAARGYRRMERVRATTEVLLQFQQRTALIGWLNPMPVDRWERSTAEMIAYLVPMDTMDDDGLGHALDVVRGQDSSNSSSSGGM